MADEASLAVFEDDTRVTGSVSIGGPDLETVERPVCLREIGGNLEIIGDALTNVHGLSNLTSVGSDLFIESNTALASLDGLRGLTSVKGLSIHTNAALPTCAAEALLARLRGHGWAGEATISRNDDEGAFE